MSPDAAAVDLWIRVVTIAVGLFSAAAGGGAVWALKSAAVGQIKDDVRAIRQALGLELVDGEIRSAFVLRHECRDHEQRSDSRIAAAEGQLLDHEGRISSLEGQAGA